MKCQNIHTSMTGTSWDHPKVFTLLYSTHTTDIAHLMPHLRLSCFLYRAQNVAQSLTYFILFIPFCTDRFPLPLVVSNSTPQPRYLKSKNTWLGTAHLKVCWFSPYTETSLQGQWQTPALQNADQLSVDCCWQHVFQFLWQIRQGFYRTAFFISLL